MHITNQRDPVVFTQKLCCMGGRFGGGGGFIALLHVLNSSQHPYTSCYICGCMCVCFVPILLLL